MHYHSGGNQKRLLAAFIVTMVFTVVELIGGFMSGSLALLADAGHMLTDAAALLTAWLAVYFSRRKPTGQYTFGLLRLTTLAAFLNALTLLVISIFIIWEAIHRFWQPQPVAGGFMLVMTIIGLLANIFSFWLLHHGNTEKNLNMRAAALHILGDLLGFAGAIVAALMIMFTGWTPIDPILSILLSLLVLRSGWFLIRESFQELLEGTPRTVNVSKLKRDLTLSIDEIDNVHHVHVWQIGEKPMLTLHAQVTSSYNHDQLLYRIQHHLYQIYQITHVTVQLEYQPCAKDDCVLGLSHQHH